MKKIYLLHSFLLFTANIYKAQRAIFGSNEQPVIASIPSTYHIGVEVASFLNIIQMTNIMMNNNNNLNKNNNLPMNMNTMPQQVNTGGDMPMNVSQTLNHLILEAAQSQLNTQHMMQNMQMPLLQNDAPFISMPQTSVSPFNDMRDSCKLISNSEINKIILVFCI